MNSLQFLGALELGFLYALVSLGVYMSYKIINTPDLTIDGSFPLGAAVCAALIVNDYNPSLATIVAILAGVIAGLITGYLQVRLKILALLSGILTMTALYSVNLRVMGKPNIALLDESTLFTVFNHSWATLSTLALIVGLVVLLLNRFLNSQLGLALRAVGINPHVSPTYGINVGRMRCVGLGFSNALGAFAGALFAQAHGFADISMGTGTLITGLAAIIVGESLVQPHNILIALTSCVLGSILYRLAIAFALNSQFMGLNAADLNLITAFLVVFAMLIPKVRKTFTIRD